MALWPFRRKGSRRRSRTAPQIDSAEFDGRGRRETDSAVTTGRPAPTRGKRDGSNKLQRRNRAYSFSPGRRDTLRIARARKESVPPLPTGLILAATDEASEGQGGDRSFRADDDLATRVPTLHHNQSRNKRRGQPLPRKKSSKRRKDDHDREAEIKAMSQFMPTRPATDSWIASRPLNRESKRYRTGLNRSWDNDLSDDMSLPVAESVHSRMSSDSEGISWKVSALDALAPRPTIRCASNPVYGAVPSSAHGHSQSSKRRTLERGTIDEATLKAHKRIDDLANDLDASDLRELMERDHRRREKKKEKDRERVERRLARRAEKQRVAEAAAASNGTPPPQNLERGVLGREMAEVEGNRTSAVITSSRRRPSKESPQTDEPSRETDDDSVARKRTPSPLDEFHRTDSIQIEREPLTPVEAVESKPTIGTVPEESPSPSRRSISPKILNFIRSRKSRSNSPKQSDKAQVHSPSPARIRPEDASSVSRTSDGKSPRAWKSFFRWGKRRGSGPSSFSNTSRDSMLASHPPPPVNYIPPRQFSSSGVPKRTMSRFREDLPELPISPPDSRVASPEAEPFPTEPLPIIQDDVVMRYDSPSPAAELMRATPSSMHRDEVEASPAPQSMSLASIDSEASWLSGRVSRKRTSSGIRNSLQNPPRAVSALSNESEARASEHTDDDHIVDDEYLNSVVPRHPHRDSTGEARPSSDQEEEVEAQPKWGAVGQVPVMHHRETMRSREGLLQSFDDDDKEFDEKESEDDEEPESPDSPVKPQRATSVNLGKGHLRNFSAGSAKLLEISPRPSGERRRSALMERPTQ
ncbi:hypothetical protein F5Y15DRAFT_197051 [Xylariaceae sp. FL0016]|nr:hypothetical protein F5Y15DRAFT_197051 [Xylariaceae sp. FL0016]